MLGLEKLDMLIFFLETGHSHKLLKNVDVRNDNFQYVRGKGHRYTLMPRNIPGWIYHTL